MSYSTIRWRAGKMELLDQRKLPGKVGYLRRSTAGQVHAAIKKMVVRGAPAIGVAGAYGVYLGIRTAKARDHRAFMKEVEKVTAYLSSARPTARNLFWAMERMQRIAEQGEGMSVAALKKRLLSEAHDILEEDIGICRTIGANGKSLVPRGARVLTHCNAGGLATAGYGTALGVIFSSRNKIKRVYADETRPVLQGARLTVWELTQEGIPTTLISDNMAASHMAAGKIDMIVVGADRIAANGDTANKIGTYGLAVLAMYHGIPFYIAAPVSTFDMSIPDGGHIPIEERDPQEVRNLHGRLITVRDVDVDNPAFDVTPARLITAIITEKGVIPRPCKARVKEVVK